MWLLIHFAFPKKYLDLLSSAYPLDDIQAKTREGASIIHMILNNLDPKVAQFPEELVTYGGNGQVFSNWAQVSLILCFLINYLQ